MVVALVESKKVDSKRPPKLTKKCMFNGVKHKKDAIVATYQYYCLQLKCVPQEGSNKAVLELQDIEDCTYGEAEEGPAPKAGKKKVKKCVFNNKKFKKGRVVEEVESKCFQLMCSKSKTGAMVIPKHMEDCEYSEDDHDDHDDEYHWSYHGDSGPETWQEHFELCGGQAQSPIDIMEDSTEEANYEAFEFINYDKTPSSMTLSNNGHTAQVGITSDPMPTIRGGGLPATYQFLQYHFHWGGESNQGSEHLLSGKAYPMEVHLVHWNKNYADVVEALGMSDGLAVLGFMFTISPNPNPLYATVVDHLKEIKYAGNSTAITTPLPLKDYIGADTENFFRYEGSLTTPTCNEAVVWTVFKREIGISEEQMEEFRSLFEADMKTNIVDNFRPVQGLNGRTVYANTYQAPGPAPKN